MSDQYVCVSRELLHRIDRMYTDGMSIFGECEEIRALLAQPAEQHQGEPAAYQFQDRDGKWCGFMNERHYQNTLADGSWPIRPLYTHAGPGEVERLRDEISQIRDEDLKWQGLREQEAEIENPAHPAGRAGCAAAAPV